MDIRQATVQDLPGILEMALAFAEKTAYSKFIEPSKVGQMAAVFLTDPTKIILINEEQTGMVWGFISQFPWGSARVGTEMIWYVSPEERGKGLGKQLLKALNDWSISQGCKILTLTGLDADVASIYKKAGFQLYEHTYFKELT